MPKQTAFDLTSRASAPGRAVEEPDLESRPTGADHQPGDHQPVDGHRPSRAVALRRGFLVAAPILAGLLATVGAVADPAAGISGDTMLEIYFDNPDRLQFKSLGYHWSYALWIVPAMLVVPLVRGRGAWLATISGFLGFLGVATMPGLLLSDWFDSAIGAVHGLEGYHAVYEVMQGMWGVPVFTAPGIIAFFGALPLAMLTLWRARLARWWGAAAAVAAVAAFVLSNATWPGAVIATLFLGVVSVAFWKATSPARRID